MCTESMKGSSVIKTCYFCSVLKRNVLEKSDEFNSKHRLTQIGGESASNSNLDENTFSWRVILLPSRGSVSAGSLLGSVLQACKGCISPSKREREQRNFLEISGEQNISL